MCVCEGAGRGREIQKTGIFLVKGFLQNLKNVSFETFGSYYCKVFFQSAPIYAVFID